MTREAGTGAPGSPAPRPVGAGRRPPGPASSAPRRASSRTARVAPAPRAGPPAPAGRARAPSAASRRRRSGCPPAPHGPGPSSPAVTRVISEAGTAARPAGSTLHGSHRRSATDSTAGSAISTSCVPSSCSSSRRRAAPASSSARTPLANGRSSSSATSGPTCPVSPSMELRPSRTRSKGPAARSAAARARAVARVSEPAKAGVADVQARRRPPRRPPRAGRPRRPGARG